MSSRLPTDEALEKEDRLDEIKKKKKKKKIQPIPNLLQAQQAPALPYAKVAGLPGTGSYPAPFWNNIKCTIKYTISWHHTLRGLHYLLEISVLNFDC